MRPGEKWGKPRKGGEKARAHFQARLPGFLVQSGLLHSSGLLCPAPGVSPSLQLVSRPGLRSILRASTPGAPGSIPANRPPDSDYPLGLSLRPPGVRFPRAPWRGPGRLRFRACDRAAQKGWGGRGDTLSPTDAVINFKGVSLRVNENTLDAWPEVSGPRPEPSAL